MGPITDKVATAKSLPPETRIAIIGGGVIGVSTALFLAERGIPVALFEKGEIAGEQSSRNWGWCRRTGRDSREMPLIVESMRLWEGMNARTGRETGFRVKGIVYAAEKEEQMARYAEWIKIARQHGIETHLLNGEQAEALAPGLTRRLAGGMSTPLDGRAEPQKAVPAMAAKAQEDGAIILQNCAVRGIETTNGRVSAVLTEKGRVRCEAVVVAGGAWSRLIISGFKAHLPQLKVRSSVFRTAPIEGGVEPAIAFSDFALRKRLDGGYTVASLSGSIADIVPDSFRFFRDVIPSLSTEWRSLRFRERFFEEAFQWGRPDVHLRENPHSGPRTAPHGQCAGARSAEKGNPGFCASRHCSGMGRANRHHAGYHSGHIAASGRRGPHRGDRLFRPWLRHRPRRGAPRRRYGLQRNAARRPLSVSYLPLFRRNKNPH
ncbi:sarcosine oxidase subunit beta [Brucella vulpis]|nr:sarcosine oxidase subunit beta [Brucella vulpis]CUW51253.1 sarcosine oxidase subunit beta [Brucella vulpis]